MRLPTCPVPTLAFAFLATQLSAAATPAVTVPKIPVAFEPNRGQFDRNVQFASRSGGYLLQLLDDGVSIRFSAESAAPVRLVLEGRNPSARWTAQEQSVALGNYLVGDSGHWVTAVPQFGRTTLANVYPGIDLLFYGVSDRLEYDFVVHPGANPASIRYRIEGASIQVTGAGDLLLSAGSQHLTQRRPVAYQASNRGRREVPAAFLAHGNEVSFSVGRYNGSADLVIDPVLLYQNLGGTGAMNLAITDAAGNIYATGSAAPGYATSANAYQKQYGGGTLDAVVVKLSKTGSLLWATYLGGSGSDVGWALALDASGNVVVMGATSSSDFPMVGNSVQKKIGGGQDAFVAKLDPSGSTLLYSTYYGGTASETVMTGGLDSQGNIVVCGGTASTDYKTTTGSAQIASAGGTDGFLFKLSADGSAVIFSTFLGGSANDQINALAFDQSDNIYVGGQTTSTDLKTTTGAAQPKTGGSQDAFVAKLDPAGKTLGFMTYLGGTSTDYANGIAAVGDGSAVWVTGFTQSSAFPVSANAMQKTMAGNYDAFMTKLDSKGALVASSYFGGTGPDQGTGVFITGSYVTFVVQMTTTVYDAPGPPFATGKGTIPEVLFATMNRDLSALVATIPYTIPTAGTYFDFPICTNAALGSNVIACGGKANGSGLSLAVLVAQVNAPTGSPTTNSVRTAWGTNTIAQNTWIEIHGANLVPDTTPASGVIWSSAPEFASGRMPTQLGGVSATVNGKPAYVYFYCSAVTSTCPNDQINVLTPLDTKEGTVQIVVNNGNVSSAAYSVNMTTVNPTFLLFNSQGYTVAVHSNYGLLAPSSLYPGSSTPATPGEPISLYAIGFGMPNGTPPVDGSSTQGGLLPVSPTCQMGLPPTLAKPSPVSNSVAVTYAGLISPGLYQLNVTVPLGAASGDNLIACNYFDGTHTQAGALITVK